MMMIISDSLSLSKRYLNFKRNPEDEEEDDDEGELVPFSSSSLQQHSEEIESLKLSMHSLSHRSPYLKKKKLPLISISKLRSALSFGKNRSILTNLGHKVVITLFGYRQGRVHFAFQDDPKLNPAFIVQLAAPTSVLVREMASGMVRIALECEKNKNRGVKLFEEKDWRAYCNGRKCGYATRRECGVEERRILDLVGPVSMGAGVLPELDRDGGRSGGNLMYMRARFERVVGSKHSEAFYMMNPNGHGRPELSIYFIRV